MNTAAIIEARMTSTRLPGKILLPVLKKPLLSHLVERLHRSRHIDQIIIATTTNGTDDVVEELASGLNVGCYRGSEEDVLDRVLHAARHYGVDIIVEVTGDCPLIDPAVVDRIVAFYRENSFDYVSNTLRRSYPRGMDIQVFSTKILEQVSALTQDPVDHEHVSLYIYTHPERFSLHDVESGLPEKHRDHRLTVDTREDFEVIKSIYEGLYTSNPAFSLEDILDFLDKHPYITGLNQHIQQKKVR